MTKLEIRRVPFDFADDVPFGWHKDNPEFACMMNMISVMAIAFEKYVVRVVREAQPRITDEAVAEEADGFLRQEAQHARAHRQHLRALTRTHPGLQEVVDGAVAAYDELFDVRPLEFHLAYIADLEATFTPTFKMFLDHEDDLFRPGDDRVASLFLWHFVEEIEHRSSALVICDHVVANKWYRLWLLPSVLRHMHRVTELICDGFNEQVPLDVRKVDARGFLPALAMRRRLAERFPRFVRDVDTRFRWQWGACQRMSNAAPTCAYWRHRSRPIIQNTSRSHRSQIIGSHASSATRTSRTGTRPSSPADIDPLKVGACTPTFNSLAHSLSGFGRETGSRRAADRVAALDELHVRPGQLADDFHRPGADPAVRTSAGATQRRRKDRSSRPERCGVVGSSTSDSIMRNANSMSPLSSSCSKPNASQSTPIRVSIERPNSKAIGEHTPSANRSA